MHLPCARRAFKTQKGKKKWPESQLYSLCVKRKNVAEQPKSTLIVRYNK